MAGVFISIDSDLIELQSVLENYTNKGLENTVDKISAQAVQVMTESVREFMPAGHRLATKSPGNIQRTTKTASGRLWSGWGVRQQVAHDDSGSKKKNPSSDGDNYWAIKKISTGSTIIHRITTGTTIPYSEYVDEGKPRWHKGRPKYDFKKYGRQKARGIIQEFARVQLSADVSQVTKRRASQSLQAKGQPRDVGGRFVRRNAVPLRNFR